MFGTLKFRLLAALATVLGFLALLGGAWWKGRSSAHRADSARAQAVHDHEITQAAQVAQATQDAARAAEDSEEQTATHLPPPDVENRDDFEGTQ